MKKLNQLFHPVFLSALFLLILNDACLKWEYNSWFTGKLSDFTGLFVFVFFFSVLFEKKKKVIYVFTALIFIWWKSSWSQGFIDFWNDCAPFLIHRVVDFSDLIALIVLPIAYSFRFKNPVIERSGFARLALASVVLTAFCATSLPRRVLTPEGDVALNKNYTIKKTESEIFKGLDSLGIEYEVDSIPTRFERYGYFSQAYTPRDSVGDKGQYLGPHFKYYKLKNVQFDHFPILESIDFTIFEYGKMKSNKRESIVNIYSITFADKPSHLDNWKKIRRLRRLYKRLVKKKIIKELRQ